MSDQNEAQEKSQEATPKRIERARQDGDIARSLDAQSAAAYLGFAAALTVMAEWAAGRLVEPLSAMLANPAELARAFTDDGSEAMRLEILGIVALPVIPVLLLPGAAVVIALIALRGIVFAPKRIMPKLSNISPIANAKQKYGPHGLVEFLKSAIKMITVGVILYFVIEAEMDRLTGYTRMDPQGVPRLIEERVWALLLGIIVITLVIAVLDVLWQNHSHRRRLRMSHQELRDETKQSEGDPHLRQQRRERARDIATNRMLLDVPGADVVVTNPTHYAVALKWQRDGRDPPRCVAKGTDEIAAKIREIAEKSGVPIHREPATARSIHQLVKVGQIVRREHYRAVAAAILYADRVRAEVAANAAKNGG